jgi:Flp pilus assembly protein TadD
MNPSQLIEQGNDAIAAGQIHQALALFLQATQANPQDPDAWQSLAMTHYKLQQHHQAADAIQKAINLNPNDPVLWTSLSMIQMKLGNIQAAEAASAKSRVLSWGGKIPT